MENGRDALNECRMMVASHLPIRKRKRILRFNRKSRNILGKNKKKSRNSIRRNKNLNFGKNYVSFAKYCEN